jgi:hypothetical protein
VPAERSGESKAKQAKGPWKGSRARGAQRVTFMNMSHEVRWDLSHALGADGSTGRRHLRNRADDSPDESRTDHVRVKFVRELATMIRLISILSVEQGNSGWK